MKKNIYILIKILILILIVIFIVISFKWCIRNYIVIFLKDRNVNLELGLPSDSYILFLKTNRWADGVRDFNIIYFGQYKIKYLEIENVKIHNTSNLYLIENKDVADLIFLASIILFIFYIGLLFIISNYKYTKKQLEKI